MRGAAGTRWYETLQRYVCIEFVCVLVCTLLTAGLSCTDGIFPDFPSYPDLDTHDSLIVFSDASSPHKLFVNIPISIFKFYLNRILLTSLLGKDGPVHSINSCSPSRRRRGPR